MTTKVERQQLLGPCDVRTYSITSEARGKLKTIIGNTPNNEAFYDAFAGALSIARTFKLAAIAANPVTARRKLRRLNSCITKLASALEDLELPRHTLSTQLLYAYAEFTPDDWATALTQMSRSAAAACRRAEHLPAPGRKALTAEHILAMKIAVAFRDILGEKPVATRTRSKYARCLRLGLAVLNPQRPVPTDLFRIMQAGLRMLATESHSSGAIEFDFL